MNLRTVPLSLVLLFVMAGFALSANSASTILVDGSSCTLVDAVLSANGDVSVGGCTAGSGADIISLQADILLTDVNNMTFGVTGLPVILNSLEIVGNGYTISRDQNADQFRLIAVGGNSSLTLTDVTLLNGQSETLTAQPENTRSGGAVYVHDRGKLTINNSILRGNRGGYGGGAIGAQNATTVINNSRLESNGASPFDLITDVGGALLIFGGSLTIIDSEFVSNGTDGSTQALVNYGGAMQLLNTDVTIQNSTFVNNYATSSGGVIDANEATIRVSDSTFDGNSATSGGSIALFRSQLVMTNSIVQNSIGTFGGGLYVGPESIATVTTNLFRANDTVEFGNGGAIGVYQGELILNRSTVANNMAHGYAAGLLVNEGTASVNNSTFSGNLAQNGGAIGLESSTVAVNHSTITQNSAESNLIASGGGIFVSNSALTLNGSIVSGNQATVFSGIDFGQEIHLTAGVASRTVLHGNGANIIGHTSESGVALEGQGTIVNNLGDDETPSERIGAILNTILADNGGATQTHALVSGSPAIDRVNSSECEVEPIFGVDQRNGSRNVDGDGRSSDTECDAGAFEYNAEVFPEPTTVPAPTTVPNATATPASNVPTPTPAATVDPFANATEFAWLPFVVR